VIEGIIDRALMDYFPRANVGDSHEIHRYFKARPPHVLKAFYAAYNWPRPEYR
jgi:hypothetical protein